MDTFPFTFRRVVDGDTFEADVIVTIPALGLDAAIRKRSIRLYGIDTWEKRNLGGPAAMIFTQGWLYRYASMAHLVCYGLDSPYKRLLSDVVLADGRSLVADLRAAGHEKQKSQLVVLEAASIQAGIPVYKFIRSNKGKVKQ